MLKHPILIALGLSFIGSMTGCSDCTVNASGLCVPNEQAAATTTDGGTDGGTVVGSADGGTADGGSSGGTGVGGFAEFGTTPNGAHLSLDCSPFNVPAFTNTDCLYSHWDGDVGDGPGVVNCTLKMADRNGLVIGTATPVSFESEAGAISPTATSPEFDPAKAITDQETLGHAVGYLEVFGSPLPPDVTPFTGEPSIVNDYGCGSRTANPRDGYVTVIAWVRGEEGFVDVNHNGKYDLGEPFVDVGEPYVDANDNGQWDPGEWFYDVNGNNKYDGPNGVWDGATKIWTQTVVVYTGAADGPFPLLAPGSGLVGTHWVNNMLSNPDWSGDACSGTPAAVSFTVAGPVTGPPPVPASSASYVVVASDLNLNMLSTNTTYAVTVDAPGKVLATYLGASSYADWLGFNYSYWPCSGGTCANECTAPGACAMKPAIGSFTCGVAAGVTVTGVAPADGTNILRWSPWTTYTVYNGSHIWTETWTRSVKNN